MRRRSSSNVVCLGPTSCPEALFTVVAVGAPREAAGTERVDLHIRRLSGPQNTLQRRALSATANPDTRARKDAKIFFGLAAHCRNRTLAKHVGSPQHHDGQQTYKRPNGPASFWQTAGRASSGR
jgi:hypothetical protein